MANWLARAQGMAARPAPANDAAHPAATPEQATELRELVAAILPHADDAERANVLSVALADAEAALMSFRALAADLQPVSLPDPDTRRMCRQCANLTPGGLCLAASRGELARVPRRMYSPPPEVLGRCEGYAAKPGDSDQRPGRERWPGLMARGAGYDDE